MRIFRILLITKRYLRNYYQNTKIYLLKIYNMNYPLISEYIEAIKAAEDNFEGLTSLRAVLEDDGLPVMTSGNFAVVFKMRDEETGRFYALKCFTKEQEGRAEAYHQIAQELKDVDSPYLVSLRYLEKELFVDTNQTYETVFPVLLMDWVEGITLDKYIRRIIDDGRALSLLATNFRNLAIWLLTQPFAHGDLKPDNILVKNDGSLVLVDYDGMFVPAMKGQKAKEIGSPDFRHPLRTEDKYDEHIDDFPILSILLSLCVLLIKPDFLKKYGAEDRLLFSQNDYIDIQKSNAYNNIPSIIEKSTNYKLLFEEACKNLDYQLKIQSLTPIYKLFSAIDLQEETKEDIKNNDVTGTVKVRTDISYIDPYPWFYRDHTDIQLQKDNTIFQRVYKRKREQSTKWQAAILLQILTVYIGLVTYTNNHSDINSGFWSYLGGGLCVGSVAWFFCFFDYIKRDGSFGNCLIALILFPITIYYVFYRIICLCINIFKEWRD